MGNEGAKANEATVSIPVKWVLALVLCAGTGFGTAEYRIRTTDFRPDAYTSKDAAEDFAEYERKWQSEARHLQREIDRVAAGHESHLGLSQQKISEYDKDIAQLKVECAQ